MTQRDDEAIARQEANDTFQSITDLDSIADTMFIAVTFLLTAVATWTAFAFDQLEAVAGFQELYTLLIIACVLSVAASVFFFSISLVPRSFYGSSVGSPFLTHRWLLWANDDLTESDWYRLDSVSEEEDIKRKYEEWLEEEFAPDVGLSSRATVEFARLCNYKHVARIKARNNAYGIALFRVSVVLFVALIIVGIFGNSL